MIPKPRLTGLKSTLGRTTSAALVCHRKPDGDAIGATVGLGLALEARGTAVHYVCVDPIPTHYRFLPHTDRFVTAVPKDIDLVCLLDCGSDKLSGLNLAEAIGSVPLVELDHHPKSGPSPKPRRLAIYDQLAAATAEIVYEVLDFAEYPIDRNIATALLTGIVTDTAAFQTQNTSARTFQVAAALLAKGARHKEILKNCFYNSSIPKLRLWGTAMSRIEQNSSAEGIVTTVITREDIEECGAHPDDLEGLVGFLNAIPGVPALMLLTDLRQGEVKGSLRTRHRSVEVNKLAHVLGGGGHAQAAGFSVPGRLAQNLDNSWKVLPPEATEAR